MSETAVLIVGAGPAGLVLALSLLQNGVPVRIVEKTSSRFIGQRGSAIIPRSLELYNYLDVLPDVLKKSVELPPIKACVRGKGVSEIIRSDEMSPYMPPTPDCPYFGWNILGQDKLQGIFTDHATKHGGTVEYGTELKSFEQYDDHIMAHLVKNEGAVHEDVRFSYIVGTDGAKSVVRKQLGLSFVGETRDQEAWVFADVIMDGPDPPAWYMWGNLEEGYIGIRSTEEQDHWLISVQGKYIDGDTLSTNQELFLQHVRNLTGLKDLVVRKFLTLRSFHINIRMVDRFNKGRAFLSGDAAHCHSFTGGQGLNSSIQDAFNLAWKLALVYKSASSPQIFESYSAERVPVIASMLEKTTTVLSEVSTHDSEKNPDKVSPWARGRSYFQLDMGYRSSPIVYDELDSIIEDRVTAGDRAPDAPCLVPLHKGFKPGTSRLFDIFKLTRHTALIFPTGDEDISPYLVALGKYPSGTVLPVVVVSDISDGAKRVANRSESAEAVVFDRDGYCWLHYPTVLGAKVVIVRPDGCVGAIASTARGIEQYRTAVFLV